MLVEFKTTHVFARENKTPFLERSTTFAGSIMGIRFKLQVQFCLMHVISLSAFVVLAFKEPSNNKSCFFTLEDPVKSPHVKFEVPWDKNRKIKSRHFWDPTGRDQFNLLKKIKRTIQKKEIVPKTKITRDESWDLFPSEPQFWQEELSWTFRMEKIG